ncbi:MAG TPA: MBL fold metallo-hydrolase [Steroidobacter sp.]|uniref:MBL fold metallo-hydrolase n=1 Tax=Steroidobacter sp. TaxID=1978227 RepID=UPI002EDB7782
MTDEPLRDLTYPWGRTHAPPGESPLQVAPGVYWARFPMPGSLDHINLWLLEDGEGWTIVDTCLDVPASRQLWERLLAGFMGGQPLKRVICTHMHPDHVGLAGWLCERFGSQLLMTRQEFLMCKVMLGGLGNAVPKSTIDFYRAAGYGPRELEDLERRFGSFSSAIHSLPDRYWRLAEGDELCIGAHRWQVVIGNGHSPEHACLYCPELKLLISGDQVLPNITSNVSVLPLEPQANPLRDWLDSCRRLRQTLPADLLVLPAHEFPFHGLELRLTQLIDSQERDLRLLWEFLDTPKRAVDCFPVLFKREVRGAHKGMATGEALAHMNYLVEMKQISRVTDDEGVHWYRR